MFQGIRACIFPKKKDSRGSKLSEEVIMDIGMSAYWTSFSKTVIGGAKLVVVGGTSGHLPPLPLRPAFSSRFRSEAPQDTLIG